MLINVYSSRETERIYSQELIHRRVRSIHTHVTVMTENILVLPLRRFDHKKFPVKTAQLSENSIYRIALARSGRASDECVRSQTVNIERDVCILFLLHMENVAKA